MILREQRQFLGLLGAQLFFFYLLGGHFLTMSSIVVTYLMEKNFKLKSYFESCDPAIDGKWLSILST